jgi:hypothetical protein
MTHPHWERSNALSDSLRKLLGLVNTGGIAIILAMAGALAGKGVRPGWAGRSIAAFIAGLVLLAISHFFAQHRAGRRARAAEAGLAPPRFAWWKRGLTWNIASLAAFVAGSVLGICELESVVLPNE